MFLTAYSHIFHQAACETVNQLLSGKDFDKGEWNTYLQRTYGINKRHANGVIHFAKGAYQSAVKCRENHIKTLTEKLKSAEKWVKTKTKLLKDGNKFYRKKNWQKSKTGLKLPLSCSLKYRNTNCVVEKLDFSKKKIQLREKGGSLYARMLSGWAYARFIELLISILTNRGIKLHQTNPAYSSIIGCVKYVRMYGISDAVAAALVLARRGMKLSERIKPHKLPPILM